jgi:hypothetical protein
MIMVLLLFRNNCRDGSDSSGIYATQHHKLLLQVSKHNTLDRESSGSDGASAKEPGDKAEGNTAETTQQIAAAARPAAALQLRAKDGAMPQLMRPKICELTDHAARSEARHENLPAIDVDSAMLTSMIDLNNAVADFIGGCRLRDQSP